MNYRLCILAASLLSTASLWGEDFETASTKSDIVEDVVGSQSVIAEFGTIASMQGNYIPFHLYANRHGVFSLEGSQIYNRGYYGYKVSKDKFSFETAVDAYLYYFNQIRYYSHHFHLQQLYIKGNWGKYTLMLGNKEEAGEFVPTLSSGSMLWSGNARPAPTLRIGIDDFIPTFITGNIFEVKVNFWWSKQTDGCNNRENYEEYETRYAKEGYVSHYWDNITDNRQHSKVENAWLHRKSFFIRTTSEMPVMATIGFEHAVMYGGKVNDVDCSGSWNWLRGMLGGSGKAEGNQFNHAITQNYRVDLKQHKYHVGIYKQHYSDDMEGGLFSSGADGLWGAELTLPANKWVHNVVIEYLQTTNQGGVVYANDVYTKFEGPVFAYRTAGNSNFYHDQHMGSWTHYGMILGNPLIASPLYNEDFYPDITSNMLKAYHLALNGRPLNNLSYTLYLQHTDSWGTPYAPFGKIKSNTSVALEVDYQISSNWRTKGCLGIDRGSLYGNNSGIQLNIQYTL